MQSLLERKTPRLARVVKEFEIQFKWWVIWVILLAFRADSFRKKHPFDPKSIKRVLFLRHDKIGDMVVTLSTFHTLKIIFPNVQIGVLASPANAVVVTNDRSVDFVHVHRKTLPGLARTLHAIRERKYDVVIDLMTGASITSLIIAMVVSRGSYRFGVGKDSFGRYYDAYTNEWRNHQLGLHITEVFRAPLIPFGIQLDEGVVDGKIQLSEAEQRRGAEIARQVKDSNYRRLIGLNASAGKLDRTWGAEKFVRLVEILSRDYPDFQFVVSYAPEDIKFARKAAAAGGSNASLLPVGLSIIDVIAFLPHLDLMISVDTSICHIAAKLDVPLLALYSGNDVNFLRWRPFGRRVWTVRSPDRKQVDGITLEQLINEITRLMEELFQATPIGTGV
jgi:ADP-heptose:LPS heptosyltransferase